MNATNGTFLSHRKSQYRTPKVVNSTKAVEANGTDLPISHTKTQKRISPAHTSKTRPSYTTDNNDENETVVYSWTVSLCMFQQFHTNSHVEVEIGNHQKTSTLPIDSPRINVTGQTCLAPIIEISK